MYGRTRDDRAPPHNSNQKMENHSYNATGERRHNVSNQVHAKDTGHWDQIYATYWWRGEYLPGQKKTFFKGYSKKYGHNEAKDKDYLLISRVLMLQQHGYIDKCSKIEIHKRAAACCMATDPVVLTLSRDNFLMGDEILTNRSIYESLKSIYESRTATGSPTYVIPKPKVMNIDQDREVKISETRQYITLNAVYEEIMRLEGIGVPKGQLNDVFRKILERNPRLK
jgi:hypothetical protein